MNKNSGESQQVICIKASFYYQDQNAVSGLYGQVNFSSCLK